MSTALSDEKLDNANIGIFARFPRELRDLIWEELIPQATIEKGCRDLSIMRTCKQICHEISGPLYRDAIILFHIQRGNHRCIGTEDLWKVRAQTSRGRDWIFDDIEHPVIDIFQHVQYDRLAKIGVIIDAPPDRDPIQLYVVWKKVRELVGMLSSSKSLQRLDIILNESSLFGSSWSYTSIPHTFNTPDGGEKPFEPDLQVALLQFCGGLRGVRQSRIHMPNPLWYEWPNNKKMLEDYELLMQREKSTGTDPDSYRSLDDDIQRRLRSTYLDFEYVLDTTPGRAADFMRRNRFAQWYGNGNGGTTYLEEWASFRRPGDWTQIRELSQIYDRYQYLQLFDPLSSAMKSINFRRVYLDRQGHMFLFLGRRWSIVDFEFLESLTPKHWSMVPNGRMRPKDEVAPRSQWYKYYRVEGIPPLVSSTHIIINLRRWGNSAGIGPWGDFLKQHLVLDAEAEPTPAEAETGGQTGQETSLQQQAKGKR